MDIKAYYEVESKLTSAKNVVEIKEACLEFSQLSNADFYLFGLCKPSSLAFPDLVLIDNYPIEWTKLYMDKSYHKKDPTVVFCLGHSTPIRWDKFATMGELGKGPYKELMDEAKEYGLVSGYSLPLWSPSGEFAVFSLASRKEIGDMEEAYAQSLPFSRLFANAILETLLTQMAKDSAVNQQVTLTKREKECLFWACEGKTTWDMSKILGVSERTVIFHLNNAVEKLGANNRQHAVAKAILHGFIKPDI
jgi:LuxR family transcriptional activator of bioluminescence operon